MSGRHTDPVTARTDSHGKTTRPEGRRSSVEQLIKRTATGLGNTIGSIAESGVLFILFAAVWLLFGVALMWSQGSVDAAWQTIRDLP